MARPSKPLISRSNAAEAALEVIDEHGLEELSLSLVAKKIGVRPPSLYHHFKDKSELLQEVARIMLVKMPAVSATGQSFEEQIIARCVATRQTLLKHPGAAPLILRYFPRHMLLAAYDRAASEEPYPTPIQMTVIDAVEKYTYGAALFEASARSRGIEPMPAVDSEKYPSLAKAIADNPFDDEQLFVESLRLFLVGVRERIKSNSIGESLD
ncbi:AcrR family transcriptional regulator [Sphingopyxis panaciterrae]|uniref:TetR/AcrR family transcriptional regulator n=1 Tax=Sphingopyxis panaciterrae TaxID=363841 RepID=UPI00141F10D2|nr:TetR/AcrR family transcriptional regulator [Sphingopyxis panaciterrae]NIJ35965.1 AcrR family transcriptional regulator [Sphingopyxis panaciterrae]